MDKKNQSSRGRATRRPTAFGAGAFDAKSPTWCASHILRDCLVPTDALLANEFFRAGDAVGEGRMSLTRALPVPERLRVMVPLTRPRG